MTLGTKGFMALSHAQCAMKASDMAYRLEAAEKLIDRLALSLRVEADIYTDNDPEDGPPEHISEALFMAKQFRKGGV